MITLERDSLVIRFPNVHEDAVLRVEFQRTLRIPDDGHLHPLPPGVGAFPLRHVDDFARRLPAAWQEHGGVMLPMYQSEALWIRFAAEYPMAIKIAAGKINAVTGQPWHTALSRQPRQDYMVVPEQPWLDGYCTDTGVIRQFVAMPLGAGYSPEEQLTGKADVGGLQLLVYPLRGEIWRRIVETRRERRGDQFYACVTEPAASYAGLEMALGMGGRMKQDIYVDDRPVNDWDTSTIARCFVHIANSNAWQPVAGEAPPTMPPSAGDYTAAGLPWFDYYADGESALTGSDVLRGLQSIIEKDTEQVREMIL